MIYIGIYSPRPGTFGAKNYPDDIPYQVKRARWNKLNTLLTEISYQNNLQDKNTEHMMMINTLHDHTGEGYTDTMKQIVVDIGTNKTLQIGDIVTVTISDAAPFKVFGKIA